MLFDSFFIFSFQLFRKLIVGFRSAFEFKIQISRFAICGNCRRNIRRIFHASFDLKGIDSRIDQVRKVLQNAHIFQAHEMFFSNHGSCPVSFSGARHVRICRRHVIIKLITFPARLCASSSVSASASCKTAEKALARISKAHRAMHESFYFNINILFNGFDLFE